MAGLIAAVLVMDLGLVASGLPREIGHRRDAKRRLTESLAELGRDLRQWQSESDSAREAVFGAIEDVDDTAGLARDAGKISDVHVKFERLPDTMTRARRANARLPSLTQRIVFGVDRGREQISALREYVDADESRELDVLDEALDAMAATHMVYSEMNEALATGFGTFEELLSILDDLVRKLQTSYFRSKKEAAQWFTVRTGVLASRAAEFEARLSEIDRRAGAAASEAKAAFRRFEKVAG